jgi:hypothetical protein
LWGFGLLLPFAALGCVEAWRRRSPILLASFGWLTAAFLLSYAPILVQRRFLFGVTIPLGLLAAHGVMKFLVFLSERVRAIARRTPVLALLLALSISMTTLIFFPAHALYMLSHPVEYFYPRSLQASFDWITSNTEPDDVILSTARTGLLLAQTTGRRVFLGHEMESIGYSDKLAKVESYFRSAEPSDLTEDNQVSWVFYGPFEHDVAPGFSPKPDLELALNLGTIQVYEVARDTRR